MPNPGNIYLGIDPGTTLIGYGVVRESRGLLTPLAWGVIRNAGTDQAADKRATYKGLVGLITDWNPHAVGVERLFFLANKKTAMAVSEMRGVILLAIAHHNKQLHEFTPLQVKQQICGHGQALKHQMQKMVGMLLHISEPIEPDDAADGLALAICCSTVQKSR